MLFSSWLRKKAQKPTPPTRFRPRLEALDDRLVPSTLTVTKASDPDGFAGDGSLRGEIAIAQSGDTIVFDPSLNGQNITLGSQLVINKNLTIQGPGAGQLAISGYGDTFYGPGCRATYFRLAPAHGLRAGNGGVFTIADRTPNGERSCRCSHPGYEGERRTGARATGRTTAGRPASGPTSKRWTTGWCRRRSA